MAWTKFQGFVGGSNPLNAKSIDSQRSINLFPELIQSGTGKEGQQAYLKSRPGYEELFEVGDGPIRLIYPLKSVDRLLIVSGNELYSAYYSGSAWVTALVPTNSLVDPPLFTTSTGIVKAASSLNIDVALNEFESVIMVDGAHWYFYFYKASAAPDVEEWSPFPDITNAEEIPGSTHNVWIDGYTIFNKTDSNQFYVVFPQTSAGASPIELDPLNYASAEGDPDSIVAVETSNRYLLLFNEKSTEIWTNSGNADFPFERVSGGVIEKGCWAKYSVAKNETNVFWLGRDENGQGQVYSMRGMAPSPISTHALEQKINTYADPSTAVAYCYSYEGHSFYVLTFAEATWVYDVTTSMWHERASFSSGSLSRERFDCLAFYSAENIHVVGDYVSGKVYKLNPDVYTDDGSAISRERWSPHISASGNLMTCHAIRFDLEVGVGINGTTQGSDPMAMLTWSDDGGNTWSSERTASIGKIGEYKKRVIFRRLGCYRQRLYKLRFTDPVNITVLSADIDIEVGAS